MNFKVLKPYPSWGHYPPTKAQSAYVLEPPVSLPYTDCSMLPRGLGRSYGDSCLNESGVLLDTKELYHFRDFSKGVLEVESGVSLEEILNFAVPRGYFLPVTPGTKFVTVGGAIANDVHGKNHHVAGNFGNHVLELTLLRSNGELVTCSPSQNTELFQATIGGLGLTGLIVSAKVRLKKINSSYIDQEVIKYKNLGEFFELSSETGHEYTVAWIDCFASQNNLGKGLFIRGNHSTQKLALDVHPNNKKTIPLNFPSRSLNYFSVKAFNTLYYNQQLKKQSSGVVGYDPFFYPLDKINHWNRIYGKPGFFQYQCVVPKAQSHEQMQKILKLISKSGIGSFLVVLKMFGDYKKQGLLSFPEEGATLAMDFPNQGKKVLGLMTALDELVLECGGKVYPAKDARLSKQSFHQMYPEFERFKAFIDPNFSSNYLRRML